MALWGVRVGPPVLAAPEPLHRGAQPLGHRRGRERSQQERHRPAPSALLVGVQEVQRRGLAADADEAPARAEHRAGAAERLLRLVCHAADVRADLDLRLGALDGQPEAQRPRHRLADNRPELRAPRHRLACLQLLARRLKARHALVDFGVAGGRAHEGGKALAVLDGAVARPKPHAGDRQPRAVVRAFLGVATGQEARRRQVRHAPAQVDGVDRCRRNLRPWRVGNLLTVRVDARRGHGLPAGRPDLDEHRFVVRTGGRVLELLRLDRAPVRAVGARSRRLAPGHGRWREEPVGERASFRAVQVHVDKVSAGLAQEEADVAASGEDVGDRRVVCEAPVLPVGGLCTPRALLERRVRDAEDLGLQRSLGEVSRRAHAGAP